MSPTASQQSGDLARACGDALTAGGALALAHPGFVARDGQRELAQRIAAAIEDRAVLVAEAGTGTGKTFAYLVPALLAGGRVLLSTGTRNLQDQLFSRDLPQVLDALGVRASIALLKGRSNYVCRHYLRRNLSEGRFARREDIAQLGRIERYAAISTSGDRSAMVGVAEDAPVWSMATSTRENCLGQECQDWGECFVVRARQAAQRADVVVVNHHLFCADLALRDEGIADLLPTTDVLVFDEAHQIADVATQFFGTTVSTRALVELARDLLRAGLSDARDAADWASLTGAVEQSIRELRLAAGPPARLNAAAALARDTLPAAIEGCERQLVAALRVCDGAANRGPELDRCAVRTAEIVARLRAWRAAACAPAARESGAPTGTPGSESIASAAPDQADGVAWADVHASGLTLHWTPLSVAGPFRRHMDERPRAWVFVSATLALAGGFGHFVDAIGAQGAREFVWQSPFDFGHQALLWIPQGIGQPSAPGFADRAFEAIWPLLRANRGRAFVLCTTLRMVEQFAQRIRAAIESTPNESLELLVQGQSSRAELLERFRELGAPVLVGSASFWEGVDVPGRQLSLVVIDKLPFAPPDDPVLAARIAAARRAGKEPFRALQLPVAAMTLKQGAGRLLRSESDRGLLVVCDERLVQRSYGRELLASLPPFAFTRSFDEALSFVDAGA
ncbi:MAG: ATP-dependent DNA helicase [Burkholderiaceae bacterium]|nr:ATP-dependent DNA helicase [Burkholderiaceae bacterium]